MRRVHALPEGQPAADRWATGVERRPGRLVAGESCRTVLRPERAAASFPDFGLAVPECCAPYAAQLRFGSTLALSGIAEPLPAFAARVSCPTTLGYLGLAGGVDLNVISQPVLLPEEPPTIRTVVPALA